MLVISAALKELVGSGVDTSLGTLVGLSADAMPKVSGNFYGTMVNIRRYASAPAGRMAAALSVQVEPGVSFGAFPSPIVFDAMDGSAAAVVVIGEVSVVMGCVSDVAGAVFPVIDAAI